MTFVWSSCLSTSLHSIEYRYFLISAHSLVQLLDWCSKNRFSILINSVSISFSLPLRSEINVIVVSKTLHFFVYHQNVIDTKKPNSHFIHAFDSVKLFIFFQNIIGFCWFDYIFFSLLAAFAKYYYSQLDFYFEPINQHIHIEYETNEQIEFNSLSSSIVRFLFIFFLFTENQNAPKQKLLE